MKFGHVTWGGGRRSSHRDPRAAWSRAGRAAESLPGGSSSPRRSAGSEGLVGRIHLECVPCVGLSRASVSPLLASHLLREGNRWDTPLRSDPRSLLFGVTWFFSSLVLSFSRWVWSGRRLVSSDPPEERAPQAPRVSFSHFLRKSGSLPSILVEPGAF